MALRAVDTPTSIIEDVIAKGDLKALTSEQRARYYTEVCNSMGLNPMTKPFDYLTLNGKLQLYATKGATDQLRKIHGIGITVDSAVILHDIYTVTVTAMDASGRKDSDIGAISVKGLQGDALANAMMKAITKAKRRVTMSMCGLGMLDETEIETIPHAQRVEVEEVHVTTEHPRTPLVASTTTESNVSDHFDDRLYDAIEMPKPASKKAMDVLWKEAVHEKDADKVRKLITVVPDFEAAKWMLDTAADKYGINTPEMIAALKDRPDNPDAAEEGEFAVVED